MTFVERLKRVLPWFLRKSNTCEHVALIQDVERGSIGCEECLKTGDTWVHLRVCRTCGHVGCCDMSKNKHATRHFRDTGHPIMQSVEEGENWMWCYIDEIMLSGPEPS